MKKTFVTISLLFLLSAGFGQNNQAVPFTLQDRDRIMRTEQKVESLRKEMNTRFEANDKRFESLEKRMDQQNAIMMWGFGIITSLVIFLPGYNIWDRRTALNPVREKVIDVEAKQNNMIKALKEHSKKDPKLADILKSFGIF